MEGSNQYSGLLGRISGAEIVVVSIEQDRFYPGIPLAGAAAAYAGQVLGNLSSAGLLSCADLSRVAVLGHSMGALITADFATSPLSRGRPELRGIVVLHAFPFLASAEDVGAATLPNYWTSAHTATHADVESYSRNRSRAASVQLGERL